MKASELVFCVDFSCEDEAYFSISTSEYFEENGCTNDSGDDDENISNLLPCGFSNSMEASWEYDGDWRDGKEKLLAAGLVYSEELHDSVNC